jgi:antitoxin MazE
MTTSIVKWGNSQGIRLPKTFLQNINISENDTVDVLIQNETIVIKKNNSKKHQTTKERILKFYGEEGIKNVQKQKEINWGKPLGREI